MYWTGVCSGASVALMVTGGVLAAHGTESLYMDAAAMGFQASWITLLELILSSAAVVFAGVLLHIASLSPARSHTLKSLYNQLMYNRRLRKKYDSVKRRFHDTTTKTAMYQDQTLKEILKTSSDTLYGTDHNFRKIRTMSEFRSRHKLTNSKYYETYVQMILDGKDNVLFPEPVNYLCITSGTSSGRCKIFPRNSAAYTNTILMTIFCGNAEMYSYPGMFSLKKLHDIRLIKPTTEVKPGVFRGPASSTSYPPWPFTASPPPVFKIRAEKDALYAHAYFGLLEPDLKIMSFLTAAAALKFFRLVEERFGELCDDIEHGTLVRKLGVSGELRQQLQDHIRPDPDRAAEVRDVMRKGCGNVVQRLWPGCSLVKGSATGTYENSAKLLRRYIGDTPIYSPYHIASEALYGVCVNSHESEPGVIEYTIIPQANFYEFIAEENAAEEQPDTLLATEVEIGKTYEIVITTRTGLFRYRSEDLVKVTGFAGSAPKYQFRQRTFDYLSANEEKYSEVIFNKAVRMAEEKWTGTIQHYMATENIHVDNVIWNNPRYYYIFVELVEDEILTDTEKELLGTCVRTCHERYREMVAADSIKEPVVLQMARGTFEGVGRLLIDQNPEASSAQYKPTTFTRKPEILNYLLDHQLK